MPSKRTLNLEPYPDSGYDAWLAQETERRFRLQFLPLYDDESVAREKLGAIAHMAPPPLRVWLHSRRASDCSGEVRSCTAEAPACAR
jgi:hypothetical protein